MTHKNVQEALVAILDELPAIGKNQRAPAVMGGYGFRGIDDVLNALNPLLGKHGVFYTPEVLERIDGQFTNAKGNITWTVKLHVQYTFHHAASALLVTATVWGEAHDSGDKATQKALTAAQKSMLFQVFAINTADQADSDSERHETIHAVAQPYGGDAESGPDEEAVPDPPVYLSGNTVATFLAKCAEHGLTPKDIDSVVMAATGRTPEPTEVHADELDWLRKAFDSFVMDRAETAKQPGKSVPKKVGPTTEGVADLKVPSEVV